MAERKKKLWIRVEREKVLEVCKATWPDLFENVLWKDVQFMGDDPDDSSWFVFITNIQDDDSILPR